VKLIVWSGLLVCEDNADWCDGLFAGYCYDPAVESTCCARCAQVMTNDASMYTWYTAAIHIRDQSRPYFEFCYRDVLARWHCFRLSVSVWSRYFSDLTISFCIANICKYGAFCRSVLVCVAAAKFICHEKNIHVYINVKDRRAARKE